MTPRGPARSRWRRAGSGAAALLLYVGVAGLLAPAVVRDPLHTTVSGGDGDGGIFLWFLAHTSRALLHDHGHGLLFTTALNAPLGVNAMWNTGLLLPGIVLAPVTALGGAVLTNNVLVLLGPAVTAWTAWWCAGSFLQRRSARLLTGLLSGFSPALMAAELGHFQLTLLFLVPPLLLLSTDAATGRRGPVRSGLLLGLLAACQLLIGEEVLALTGIAVVVMLAVLAAQRPSAALGRALPVLLSGAVAGATALALVGYPLYVQFRGPQVVHGSAQRPDVQVLDPAALLVRTQQLLDVVPLHRVVTTTRLNASESMGFLGLPLLLLLLGVVWAHRRDTTVRVLALTSVALGVLALGFTLHLGGRHTGLPVPWGVTRGLPVVDSVLPVRWMLVLDMLLALLVGLAVDRLPQRRRWRLPGLGLLALTVASLLPAPLPHLRQAHVPAYFTAQGRHLHGTVVVLPVPIPTDPRAMVWAAGAGAPFAMPGGYFLGPGPAGRPTFGSFPRPLLERVLISIGTQGYTVPVTPALRESARTALRYWGAHAFLVGPCPHEQVLVRFVTDLLGRPPQRTGGVSLWTDVDPDLPGL